jgi:hypothetical protein
MSAGFRETMHLLPLRTRRTIAGKQSSNAISSGDDVRIELPEMRLYECPFLADTVEKVGPTDQ